MSTHPALFLDRDGVIIENRANYVRAWSDVEIYPQALRALARIRAVPHKIILVTNQSAVGRGIITLEQARLINEQLLEVIRRENGRVDAVYMCPHAPADQCTCRKPKPGLLLQAAHNHHIDLTQSIMIGDAVTDLQAGQAAGCRQLIMLRTGRGQTQANLPAFQQLPQPPTPRVYDTLAAAFLALFPETNSE